MKSEEKDIFDLAGNTMNNDQNTIEESSRTNRQNDDMILEEKNENILISKQQNPLLADAKVNDDIQEFKELEILEEEMQLEGKNP